MDRELLYSLWHRRLGWYGVWWTVVRYPSGAGSVGNRQQLSADHSRTARESFEASTGRRDLNVGAGDTYGPEQCARLMSLLSIRGVRSRLPAAKPVWRLRDMSVIIFPSHHRRSEASCAASSMGAFVVRSYFVRLGNHADCSRGCSSVSL